MQRTRLVVSLISLALGACASTPQPTPEMPEPLAQHKQLQKGVGTWEGTLTMWMPGQPEQKIANHAWYTFWYVIPTLPMFVVFPWLLPRFGFWPTLACCVVLTAACFGLFALLVQRFGIELL